MADKSAFFRSETADLMKKEILGVTRVRITHALIVCNRWYINKIDVVTSFGFSFGTPVANMISDVRKRVYLMNNNDSDAKWFCIECTALLGIRYGDQVNIRFKQEVNLTVKGEIILICRRCGTINQINTEKSVLNKQS